MLHRIYERRSVWGRVVLLSGNFNDNPNEPEFQETPSLTQLFLDHAEELRAMLQGVLRNADLVNEALQATFVKILEAGQSAKEETRKGWLFRVAFNQALELRRRNKNQQNLIQKAAWQKPSLSQEHGSSATDSLIRWETVQEVREALNELPDDQQQVVRLRIYDEKTFAEIAADLQLPLGTVLTRMRLALKKLSRILNTHDQSSTESELE